MQRRYQAEAEAELLHRMTSRPLHSLLSGTGNRSSFAGQFELYSLGQKG